MKRVTVSVVIILIALFAIPTTVTTERSNSPEQNKQSFKLQDFSTSASAGGLGSTRNTIAYMIRTVGNQSLRVLNSYSSTSQHMGQVDLTEFQIAGWDLYSAEMEVATITAAAERESTGITINNDIQIQNTTLGSVTDALYQEFYNMPHDGRLENYTFGFKAPYYSAALGKAYLGVRSAYNDPQTNVTGWITPFYQNSIYTTITHDCASDAAILDENMPYFIVIDGTTMVGVDIGSGIWLFNWIYWRAQDITGTDTGYHYRNDNTWYHYEGLGRREAELQYTYTPWNKTTNAALTYLDPTRVDIQGNNSPVEGMKWAFTDESNMMAIDFISNQSVEISYEIELSYRKSIPAITNWNVDQSGSTVNWNATTVLEFPAISEQRYLNISVPSLWTATGLYNISNPNINHSYYESLSGTIRCSNMANDTWTLTSVSYNFLQSIQTFDQLDNSEIFTNTRLGSNIDINSTLSELDLNPVITGSTNLTIWHLGIKIWAPSNNSVINGKTYYLWDVGATTALNGFYTIEEYWSNGTEAGYLSKNLTLYYPTSLTASEYQVDAFTESTFPIRVDFEDTLTPQGLDGGFASLVYSFDGGVNTTLTDYNNGTWGSIVSTSGKVPGQYSVIVYAEGYAIENQSLTIYATLIYDTELLTISWSNTNNISYVQTTDLLVEYRRIGGTSVTDATVNVTIDGTPFPLRWDGDLGLYKITINGTEVFSGFGTYSLVIQAWKEGYKPQSDTLQSLTLHKEYTLFSSYWSYGTNITYIEYTVLTVTYQMSNTSYIPWASVNVTDGFTNWTLKWNGTDGTYWIRFNGTDNNPGFGTHTLIIKAGKPGYVNHEELGYSLTIRKEPTTLTLTWSNGDTISYVQDTTLIVNYTMSDGSPVIGATVNVSIGLKYWLLGYNPLTKTYDLTLNGSDVIPGLGNHSVTVLTEKAGFEEKSNGTEYITVNLESTSLTISWSLGFNITYVQQTTLTVTYKMSNGTSIAGAIVNVTINGHIWNMAWDGSSSYVLVFYGLDSPPGFGSHDLIIKAGKYGFVNQMDSNEDLILREEPTTMVYTWSNNNNITYIESTTLIVNFTMSDGSPVVGAVVNVTIGVYPPWQLVWHIPSQTYRVSFSGSDNPPGLGIHNLTIAASKFGYQDQSNNTASLTIDVEPTSFEFTWWLSNTITYVENTALYVNYRMTNGSTILGAFVNATVGSVEYALEWNPFSKVYMLIISGNNPLLGLGTHSVVVQATLFGYEQLTDSTQLLTINEESTDLVITWSNGNNPSYFEYTFLFVDYRMSDHTTIINATLNVTIGSDFWTMRWNETAGLYQVRFNGSDLPPGVGTHNLVILADRFGYVYQENDVQTLTLPVIPTTLQITWSNMDTITYVGQTTLYVEYNIYNGTPIQGAIVNITIGLDLWILNWNGSSGRYEITFNGTDSRPGFGIHATSIKAWKIDLEGYIDITEVLTITEEPTSIIINWSNGNNISYVSGTILSVRYQMSNNTAILGATVNATVGGIFRLLVWNPGSQAYETYFAGDEDPLGFGRHDIDISADKYGFVSVFDDSQELIITLEETSILFDWDPSSTITFVEYTKIRIFYLMSNGTPIIDALVNITHDQTWVASWNDTSKAYEYTWHGTDVPPGLYSHLLVIKAWKINYVGIMNTSQTLTINEEPTQIQASWSNGNSITFIDSTTLLVNFTTSNGTMIPYAGINVTIAGAGPWSLAWNATSSLYEITFINGSACWPGLGTFGLSIRGWKGGYELTIDTSQILRINSEQVSISCELLSGNTITYVGYTTLAVNYTTTDGTPITGAIVNVTISGTLWELTWDAESETYRIRFNGSDSLPGLGTHNLKVNASGYGFDALPDSSLYLIINKEPTTLTATWSAPNYNAVTYFEYTIIYVEYQMSNGSDILGASVNVTIDSTMWTLVWNSTTESYNLRLNGSDSPTGFGTYSLLIEAARYGFISISNSVYSLTFAKDPTTIEVSWTEGNNITYVEYTVLSVVYKMSNGTDITGATVNATISGTLWNLTWNSGAGAYQVQFDGNQIPPGFGTFTVDIRASSTVFVAQFPSTTLTLRTDDASATPSWVSATFDWTETVILSFDFRDSYGSLIEDATTKLVYVDSVEYGLLGSNGTYWIAFDNSFNLGLHNVWANFIKFGYNPETALSINFTINEAQTDLIIIWSSTVIDCLGQIELTVDYYYVETGASVPYAGIVANITIDGTTTLDLIFKGGLWIATFTNGNLSLGSHDVDIRAQAYGYEYCESLGIVLTVNEVTTDTLIVTWAPSNLTIEYNDFLNLSVDYTFYGGDVPNTAIVNVSIKGRLYDLSYSAGFWSVSIPVSELGIGIRTATISAWLKGYQYQTNVTVGINVTVASNSFITIWEPLDLQAIYTDTVNLSVVYLEDFKPIDGATVELSINGTIYTLAYSDVDEMWHFSFEASTIGIGVWNVTVTANKTGFADGWYSEYLTITPATTTLNVSSLSYSIFYDESTVVTIYYKMSNLSFVPNAVLSFALLGVEQPVIWNVNHWTANLDGFTLDVGVHIFEVNVSVYGFIGQVDTITITVIRIPTHIIYDNAIVIYAQESITLRFSFLDNRTSDGVSTALAHIDWIGPSSVIDLGNGTYLVQIGGSLLHIGNYSLEIILELAGYVNGTGHVNIEVDPIPTELLFTSQLSQYENETIIIVVRFTNLIDSNPIDWAIVIVTLDGVQYILLYDSLSENYSISILLTESIEPNSYLTSISANAVDCEAKYGQIELEVLAKSTYVLSLDAAEQVDAGGVVLVSVTVYMGNQPVGNIQLTLIITISSKTGTRTHIQVLTTDNLGVATVMFDVPNDATSLDIQAQYAGSISVWPAQTSIHHVEVLSSALGFIEMILRDPVLLSMVAVGISTPFLGLAIMKRKRRSPKNMIASPDSLSITSPNEVISVASPIDKMKNEITTSESGLTRSELSERLGISASKTSVIVKDLLESDPDFIEVREGSKRIIRKR